MSKAQENGVSLRFYPERRLIIMTLVGDLQGQDVIDGVKAMVAHPDYDAAFNGVADMRLAHIRAGLEETQRIAKFVVRYRERTPARWAYLVTEPSSTAMTTYYGQLIEKTHPARTHYTVAAASDYLGIELADLMDETV